MNKSVPQKYDFTTVFAADGKVLQSKDSWRKVIPREEVQKKEAEAFERGRKDELVLAEQSSQVAIENLGDQLKQILSTFTKTSHQCREDAAHLAFIVAKKVAGAALEQFELAQVKDLIEQTLSELKGSPRIKIKTSEAVASKLKTQLKPLLDISGYTGSVVIEVDPQANCGAVSLEWGEGAVAFDPQEVESRIENDISNWLVAISAPINSKITQEESADHV